MTPPLPCPLSSFLVSSSPPSLSHPSTQLSTEQTQKNTSLVDSHTDPTSQKEIQEAARELVSLFNQSKQ
jgi:hypothetical protein